MDLKDPLFSVIAFFVFVLIGVLVAVAFEQIRNRLRDKKIEDFMKSFEYKQFDLVVDTNSINALYVLANAFEKEGDFEKSLEIYHWIYKNSKDIFILKHISRVYMKAGFLKKAKDFAYLYLNKRPRDEEMLKLLIVIDEKLGDFKEIIEILEIFEELEVEFQKEKANALLKLILRGCDLEFCKSVKDIFHLYQLYPFIKREFLVYLFQTNPQQAYQEIKEDEVCQFLDLIWYRDDILDEEKFCNVLAAKYKRSCEKESIFEIEVLKNLDKDIATLEFEYVCSSCKISFPIYQTRCPHCHELFSMKLLINLTKKENLSYLEF